MVVKILVGLALLVVLVGAVVAILAAFQPSEFRVMRTTTMAAFCLVVSMDKALGGEFEKGLASMKSVAEAAAKN